LVWKRGYFFCDADAEKDSMKNENVLKIVRLKSEE